MNRAPSSNALALSGHLRLDQAPSASISTQACTFCQIEYTHPCPLLPVDVVQHVPDVAELPGGVGANVSGDARAGHVQGVYLKVKKGGGCVEESFHFGPKQGKA